jgi:hypothetical protein
MKEMFDVINPADLAHYLKDDAPAERDVSD